MRGMHKATSKVEMLSSGFLLLAEVCPCLKIDMYHLKNLGTVFFAAIEA